MGFTEWVQFYFLISCIFCDIKATSFRCHRIFFLTLVGPVERFLQEGINLFIMRNQCGRYLSLNLSNLTRERQRQHKHIPRRVIPCLSYLNRLICQHKSVASTGSYCICIVDECNEPSRSAKTCIIIINVSLYYCTNASNVLLFCHEVLFII